MRILTNHRVLSSWALTCLVLLLVWSITDAQTKQKGERVLAVKSVTGRTIGFEMGDYQHVEIRTTSGSKKSFFIFKPGLDYFLALNKKSVIVFTYEVADVNIPENGGITRVDRLASAKAGTVTYESWWKQVSAKSSMEQLDDKYGPLVRKYGLK